MTAEGEHDMETDTYVKRLLALWLALPLTALDHWLCRSRLPARIAMHYDAAGRPNSWASPDGARSFSLWFLGVILVVVTGVGFLVVSARPDRAGPALVLLYVVVGLVAVVLNGFVWLNLGA
jgi:uncharacterized membrane protein